MSGICISLKSLMALVSGEDAPGRKRLAYLEVKANKTYGPSSNHLSSFVWSGFQGNAEVLL